MTNEILLRFGLATSLIALGASAAGNDRDADSGDVTTVVDQNFFPQFEAVGYADFEGHGLMEVLIRDTSTGNLYIGDVIQFAKGDITAFRKLPFHDPNASYINLGDFNGDGKVDLLIHNNYENSARLVLFGDRDTLSIGPQVGVAFPFGIV